MSFMKSRETTTVMKPTGQLQTNKSLHNAGSQNKD